MASYMDTIRRTMEADYADASDSEKDEAVRDLIQVCSVAAGAIAIQPIPLLDVALVTPIQIALVQGIGRIHGHKLDQKSVLEILTTFGASLVAQNAIMTAVKFVPFAGWAMAMSMAYALTYAIGEVSNEYFRRGRGVPQRDLESMFKRVYREKKAEKQQATEGDATLKDKIEQLNEAKKAGLLTEEEYEKKKADLLSDF
ncbi:MAG: DUF697 domain-containing protein [Proteobacteria bacterium]|nr:DUF697 domain-containing protein [Pseudomonadota bacterium]